MPKHLAIVPAFNEEDSVASVVRDLERHAPRLRRPRRRRRLDRRARARSRRGRGAQVLRMPFNLGIGGTVQAGYVYALEHDYDIAVQVDGDGQHDARELRPPRRAPAHPSGRRHGHGLALLEACEDGSFKSTLSRRMGIRIFASILTAVTGRRVTDPTSGFRMTNRRGIELFARDYPHDYPEVEAVLMVHAHRLRSAEVPVRMRERTGGVSSINASKSVYYMVKVLLAIFVGLFRSRPAIERGEAPAVHAEPSL
jgi:glycosyltransferase involved in cell wall biosynthesis